MVAIYDMISGLEIKSSMNTSHSLLSISPVRHDWIECRATIKKPDVNPLFEHAYHSKCMKATSGERNL